MGTSRFLIPRMWLHSLKEEVFLSDATVSSQESVRHSHQSTFTLVRFTLLNNIYYLIFKLEFEPFDR